MTSQITFDQALPLLISTLADQAGVDFAQSGVIVRDASGRLAFVSSRLAASDSEIDALNASIAEKLGGYARQGGAIRFSDAPGAQAVLEASDATPIRVEDHFYNLLDRRIVGSGWLNTPASGVTNPPRFVFATLKGGVGRSTALSVAAADLARRGRNVLVIDLDLEAPGLGELLLSEDRTPKYGVIDYLVDNGIVGIPGDRLCDFIGTSDLTTAEGGRVDVMPALGTTSESYPENVLPKLSRAMTEDIDSNGVVTVDRQISCMIDAVTQRDQYDVVLIDSRAGISELAAPAVLGLGATVFFFGTAQRQTYQGYRKLFAAFQLLAQREKAAGGDAEWRSALRPVYAKASMNKDTIAFFSEEVFELFSEYIYDEEDLSGGSGDALRFTQDDITAPHQPLMIPFTPSFLDFDPLLRPGQLESDFYEQTYRPFLNKIDELIESSMTEHERPNDNHL